MCVTLCTQGFGILCTLNVLCLKVLTFSKLKLSAPEVAIALPRILPAFSSGVMYQLVNFQEVNLVMLLLVNVKIKRIRGYLSCQPSVPIFLFCVLCP